MARQLDLFPAGPYRRQTLADLDAIGERAAAKALELHAACPSDPRATTACFASLAIFGAIEILRQRGHR